MSHSTYNALWAEAQGELSNLLKEDLPPEMLRPEKDRMVFFQRLATMYVSYIQIFRQLEEAYDQIVHPQKRRLIRGILDGVMGRVLELKNEMVEKELSEYHYMDDVIQDLKLMPEDLEIPIPLYFIRERSKIVQERSKMLTNILNLMGLEDTQNMNTEQTLSLEEAIRIIQVSERGRQGRLRAKFMQEIQRGEERQKRSKDKEVETDVLEQAAVRIQKVWKGFIQRKRTKQEREEELIFLGMIIDPHQAQPCAAVVLAEANKALKWSKQEEHEEDYQRALVTIKDSLRELEGPDMKETMKDQIRQWIMECHDATGNLPDYPDEEAGGSTLIFADKTPEQLMAELAAKEEEEANKKGKGKKDDPKKKDKKKKDKQEEEEEPGLKMLPSAFLSELCNEHKTFTDVWRNRDESRNFSQQHEAELIKEEKRKEIEAEIRVQVDELMRQELDSWKLAVEGDKGRKAKASGKKKKKGGKSGKKKKKDKDLTPDRSTESLFQELVEQGLLKPAENVQLQDYIGDYSYLGTTLRQTDIEPMPSLSDVRQLMSLYAVLPLGSQVVHEKTPLVKGILLVGPAGVGKKMLVHAICKETGANLFDLSPLNLVGKYPGKSGLQMMLHMVFKVARLLQPSVVWIGDTEKTFYKKVPKDEKALDPRRLKKVLPKVLKTIKGEDRVVVVGTTNNPLKADIKSMSKVYTKIILIPRPDYSSRFVMWKMMIRRHGGDVTPALDLSSLAKITEGYTQGHMMGVVKGILTEHRVQQLNQRPLVAEEFVPHLAKIDPVFQDEEKALKAWYAKTPLAKKRAKAALELEAEKDGKKTPKKDKKGKKKGKK